MIGCSFQNYTRCAELGTFSDQNVQDMDGDWQKFNQLWKLSVAFLLCLLVYISMCGTLACATEKIPVGNI